MSSIIQVSNRLPFVSKRQDGSDNPSKQLPGGGPVAAMSNILKERRCVWIGQGAEKVTNNNTSMSSEDRRLFEESQEFRTISIPEDVIPGFNNGCCNTSIWPLFHSMPNKCTFKRDFWRAYSAANSVFAQQTYLVLSSETEQNKDNKPPLVWVHDYHLMLVPTLLREEAENCGTACRIAFFLHIPFPSYDIFEIFPWDDEILIGLLGCDLIGFHTDAYAQNFVACCERRLSCRVDREQRLIEHDGRTVRAAAFPMGVPFEHLEKLARISEINEECNPGCSMIIGVDKLDFTKGIKLRIKAFERLLDTYPEHIQKVVLFQIAVPSRIDVPGNKTIKDELEREIGRINGRFSTINWSPIRYVCREQSPGALCAFYKNASVALVTPIRGGMNFVAKEFVACQVDNPGVLILSPFTGASHTMNEALIMNPYEEFGLADTIHRALTMPWDERELRMSALRRREKKNDFVHWFQSFLGAAELQYGDEDSLNLSKRMKPLTSEDFDDWIYRYLDDACKLALLLDYDGTLAPISDDPDQALLPAEMKTVLETLVELPDVYVAVISSRNVSNTRALVGIDKITYAGNHGLEIVHPDDTKFVHPDQDKFKSLIGTLAKNLEREVCKDGAWVEDKGIILTWHFRSVRTDQRQSLIDAATAIILQHDFRPYKVYNAIEARPPVQWDKGRACIHVLRTTFGMDWSERVRIIYVGDDASDEEAMRVLSGMALTFRVSQISKGRTAANRRLHGPQSVLTMLQWVRKHMDRRRERKMSSNSVGGD